MSLRLFPKVVLGFLGSLLALCAPSMVFAANPNLQFIRVGDTIVGASAVAPFTVADVNHDGKPDLIRLVVTAGGDQVTVSLGAGNGQFGPATGYGVGTGPAAVTTALINADAHPDIIVATNNAKTLCVLFGVGNGTFSPQIATSTGLSARSLVMTDFDKDGQLDAVVAGYQSDPREGRVATLKGNANGTFGSPTIYVTSPRTSFTETGSVAVADFNGDTWPDFVASNPRTGAMLAVFLNNQNGTFSPLPEIFTGNIPGNLVTGDFNSDGHADFAFTTVTSADFGASSPGVFVEAGLGNGSGSFTFASYGGPDGFMTPGHNLIAADVDGDGILDLATTPDATSILAHRVAIFRGAANGTFTFGTQFTADYQSLWIAPSDLNNDGVLDLLVTRNDPQSQTYLGIPPTSTALVVTTAVDEDNGTPASTVGNGTSLREAINSAVTRVGPQTITFAANLAGQTILLSMVGNNSYGSSAFRIPSPSNITIQGITNGAGVTIDGGNALRPFLIDEALSGSNATLTVNDLTFTRGRGNYGAVFFNFGTLNINRCTLTGNSGDQGGILYNGAVWTPTAAAFITNSTIANNSAFVGGAIMNERALTLSHVTVTGNSAIVGGGLHNSSIGVLSLANSIVVGNSTDMPSGGVVQASSHHNLIGTGGRLTNGVNGNLVDVTNPGLQALAANGGPTKTIALATTSPAINAGAVTAGLTTDQRGVARPQGSAPDIGAFESNPTPPQIVSPATATLTAGVAGAFQVVATGEPAPTFTASGTLPAGVTLSAAGVLGGMPGLSAAGAYPITITASNGVLPDATQSFTLTVRDDPNLTVTTTADVVDAGDGQTSLREAMTYANAHAGADTITFSSGLAGQTVTLSSGWNNAADSAALRVTGETTILGRSGAPGVTIAMAAGVAKRHVVVESAGSLTVSDVTFTNGAGDYGGSFANFGALTIRRCTFAGNLASFDGGAIHSADGSTSLLIENSTFSANSAGSNANAIFTGALQTTLRHLTITGNSGGSGALLLFRNPVAMVNSIVVGNSPDGVTTGLGATFSAASTNNLFGAGGAGGLSNGANGNSTGVAASALRFGALGNNGGPTPTIAILPGSVAVNTGVAIAGITTDQRGNARNVGAAPDVGAFEEPVGSDDADGDTLSNLQEAQLGTNPASIDGDGDGFNDPTELMASSNPNSSASVPPATHVSRVVGFGPARGLDLIGTFPYAFNVGTPGAAGVAGNANFTADNAAGISVSAPNEIANWAPREFGSSVGDDTLETVFRSIRWADTANGNPAFRTVKVDLANLVAGRRYKVQLLFAESTNHDRTFDVFVDGALVLGGFNTNTAQGVVTAASAVVHEFTASAATLRIELSGTNTPGANDHNPILNGVTLELLPTALESWRTLQNLAANGSQDLANASGDGISNLAKFAFNLAPNAGDLNVPNATVLPSNGTAGLPFIMRDAQGRLLVEFIRRKAGTIPGVSYTVETGPSASNLLPLSLSGATIQSIDATWERVTVIDPTITPDRYGRVRVTTQ